MEYSELVRNGISTKINLFVHCVISENMHKYEQYNIDNVVPRNGIP